MQHLHKTGGLLLPIERLARIGCKDWPSYSSSFFSHSCALFCTHQKLNSFVLNRFRTLCSKHPGVGYAYESREFAFSSRPPNNAHCISHCEVPPCLKLSSSPPFALPSAAPTKVRSAPRAPTILPLSPSRKRSPASPASTPRRLTT